MILFLFYLNLDSTNFHISLKSNKGKYIFIKFFNTFCRHSEEFLPIWKLFVENNSHQTNSLYGEVECHTNKKLCDELIGSTYPQVLVFNTEINLTLKFNSNRTLENLLNFQNISYYYPFTLISRQEISNLSKKNKFYYLLEIPPNEIEKINLIKKSFLISNIYNCFLSYREKEENIALEVYGSRTGSDSYFNNEFNEKNLLKFIKESSIPYFSKFDDEYFNMMIKLRLSFILVIFDTDKKIEIYKDLIFKLEKFPYFSYTVHSNFINYKKYFENIKENSIQFLIINPYHSKYSIFNDNISQINLQDWISMINKEEIKWNLIPSFKIDSMNKSQLILIFLIIITLYLIIWFFCKKSFKKKSCKCSKRKCQLKV